MKSVACLGPKYSFSHIAALEYFGEQADFTFMPPLKACRAVRAGQVNFAVVPVENNSAGFVNEVLAALFWTGQVIITDEIYLPVRQNLISFARDIKDVHIIYSHWQAFAQCRSSLERIEIECGHKATQLQVASTSTGIEMASRDADAKSAAIGSAIAAKTYGLPILMPDINDNKNNMTRFFVISMGAASEPTLSDRSAFLFEVKHESGALNRVLQLFATHGINLLSLQSLPAPTSESEVWDYAFFLECTGHIKSQPLDIVYKVLRSKRLMSQRRKVRCLGSFPNRLPKNWRVSKMRK